MASSAMDEAKTPLFIIGPLTTTYTPPPPCSTPLVKPVDIGTSPDGNSVLLYGDSCILTTYQGTLTYNRSVRSACYPPGYWTQVEPSVTDYFDTRSSTFFAYSPASICPLGWTKACSASIDPRPEYQGVPQLTDFLRSGELLEICCPPGGLGCQVSDPLNIACETTFSSTSVVGTICTDSGSVGGARTLSGSSVIGLASPIALIHRPNVAEATSTSSMSGAPVPSEGAQSANAGGNGETNPTGKSQLSGGAKAGIGVGVSLGVLLLVAIGALLWYRRSRRKHSLTDSSTSHLPEYKHELGDTQTSHVPQGPSAYELENSEAKYTLRQRVGSYEVEDSNTMVGSVTEVSPTELESPRGLELDSIAAPIELDTKGMPTAR